MDPLQCNMSRLIHDLPSFWDDQSTLRHRSPVGVRLTAVTRERLQCVSSLHAAPGDIGLQAIKKEDQPLPAPVLTQAPATGKSVAAYGKAVFQLSK